MNSYVILLEDAMYKENNITFVNEIRYLI